VRGAPHRHRGHGLGGSVALASARRCRHCGSDIPLGPKFCTTCGQPLSAASGAHGDVG
jgi:predicted amidophosphoribosyltransferase